MGPSENMFRPNPSRFKKFKRSPGGGGRTKFEYFGHKTDFFSILSRGSEKTVFSYVLQPNPVRSRFWCLKPKNGSTKGVIATAATHHIFIKVYIAREFKSRRVSLEHFR